MSEITRMMALARQALLHAYAPYSQFSVGACIRTPNHQFFVGCNVENISYPVTQCAEATAIGQMIVSGEQKITEILIVASSEQAVFPCGRCRQQLSEFGAADTLIHMCQPNDTITTLRLDDLLPYAFNQTQLGVNL